MVAARAPLVIRYSVAMSPPAAPTFRDRLILLASLAGFVAFWWALAAAKADPRLLPPPPTVFADFLTELSSGRLLHHLWATLLRVALAFGLAMVIGTILGVTLGRMPRLNRWLDPWVLIFLNLPALVLIVLCYLWIGLNEVAAIAAVTLNKTAMVLVTMREGARALAPELDDLARAFALPPAQRLRHIVLPQLAPFFAVSARAGLAVIWKIVLVVEFLGRSNGIGFQIHLKFQLFDISGVLVYALAFVAVMLVIDLALIQPAERRANRWRR
ncbi:ABC transporter permease [Fuscovulum ytuae]|uniref:ABC transporter permease n=1 Tax=Fuscovulum ytuae TaxID=3042299 RepID=A0ABY8Q674_9RHOB|nr:ABC transporter permease [Fuscovulum sp. YMD61]WGV16329.1 ABC transporter permease [Fuscovulum sp. YMD61]